MSGTQGYEQHPDVARAIDLISSTVLELLQAEALRRGPDQAVACSCGEQIRALEEEVKCYRAALAALAAAAGISSPLELMAMAKTDEQTYADVLIEHVAKLRARADAGVSE